MLVLGKHLGLFHLDLGIGFGHLGLRNGLLHAASLGDASVVLLGLCLEVLRRQTHLGGTLLEQSHAEVGNLLHDVLTGYDFHAAAEGPEDAVASLVNVVLHLAHHLHGREHYLGATEGDDTERHA